MYETIETHTHPFLSLIISAVDSMIKHVNKEFRNLYLVTTVTCNVKLFTEILKPNATKVKTLSVHFFNLYMFTVLYRVHKTFLSGDYILNSLYYTSNPRSFHPNFILSPSYFVHRYLDIIIIWFFFH